MLSEKENVTEKCENGTKSEEKKPEPQKNEHFFVDYVERKDADGVYLLKRSGRTEIMKITFGHFREKSGDGVGVSKGLRTCILDDVCAKSNKFVPENFVPNKYLQDYVNDVEKFTK